MNLAIENQKKIQTRIGSLVIPRPAIPPMTADDSQRNVAIHNARAFKNRAIACLAALSFEAAERNTKKAEHFAKFAVTA